MSGAFSNETLRYMYIQEIILPIWLFILGYGNIPVLLHGRMVATICPDMKYTQLQNNMALPKPSNYYKFDYEKYETDIMSKIYATYFSYFCLTMTSLQNVVCIKCSYCLFDL